MEVRQGKTKRNKERKQSRTNCCPCEKRNKDHQEDGKTYETNDRRKTRKENEPKKKKEGRHGGTKKIKKETGRWETKHTERNDGHGTRRSKKRREVEK